MFNRRLMNCIYFLLIFRGCLFADAEKVGRYNIGVGAGLITGNGISYRQWLGRFGLQCTGAPTLFFRKNSTSSIASLGITALAKIKEARYVNLIAYFGPNYLLDRYTSHSLSYNNQRDDTFYIGGGPGLDFHFLNLSVSLMFGYCFRYEIHQKDYGTSFSGEFGFHYSF